MKRLIPLFLAVVMVITLAACDLNPAAKLTGTWICRVLETDENKDALMDSVEFYDEEKALITTPLYTAKSVTFNEDGTYYFIEDAENVRACVEEFFLGAFSDLYEGRASLAGLYEDDVSQMSETEFYQYYAEMYGYVGLEDMAAGLAAEVYNYDAFEKIESGTFSATSQYIDFDADEDELDGTVGYKVSDTSLTLTYSDDTEVYTKAN